MEQNLHGDVANLTDESRGKFEATPGCRYITIGSATIILVSPTEARRRAKTLLQAIFVLITFTCVSFLPTRRAVHAGVGFGSWLVPECVEPHDFCGYRLGWRLALHRGKRVG